MANAVSISGAARSVFNDARLDGIAAKAMQKAVENKEQVQKNVETMPDGFVRLIRFADNGRSEKQAKQMIDTAGLWTFSNTDDSTSFRNNDSPMGRGILTMQEMMALLNYVANAVMDDIDKEQNVARHAQDESNNVAAKIATITDATGTATLPQDVIDYLKANGIQIDGVDVNSLTTGTELKKDVLQTIKNAIDDRQTQASNFVQTAQLKIQQVMQSYNIATQMVNSLLSMAAEMNKQIASSIR
ncbi:hypothetical protein WKR88_27105 [Trinickia caryophylli]|uniref:Secreted effector protein SseB n=1 Tax=Trinickia caryophylli TaxID=28094 RepID=A0A1X7EXQ7_TRICW|nr:hypothetical protein [Trinickia caryophylli]PMS09681.1 secretion protein EspA [Trinickia caryophylli]TRX18451.1 secretion protein EspA [Trinickia caryophylli]WQE10764.1 hypothetical protein U0034_13295 [Trinickia caryophylli]SMF41699.1 secreted effector protein SseB [Trinickia caryophylli]GLU33139.1 hypothetical protein Busp01_29810 [Trinickia caryophylli]